MTNDRTWFKVIEIIRMAFRGEAMTLYFEGCILVLIPKGFFSQYSAPRNNVETSIINKKSMNN